MALTTFVRVDRGSAMDSWFTRRPLKRITGQDNLPLGNSRRLGMRTVGAVEASKEGDDAVARDSKDAAMATIGPAVIRSAEKLSRGTFH
jgi:hypothetical protein